MEKFQQITNISTGNVSSTARENKPYYLKSPFHIYSFAELKAMYDYIKYKINVSEETALDELRDKFIDIGNEMDRRLGL